MEKLEKKKKSQEIAKKSNWVESESLGFVKEQSMSLRDGE